MKPKLHLSTTTETGVEMYKLVISGGTDPGAEVLDDFMTVVANHGLTPQGGCFNVQALDPGGSTRSFIGGMYVQPSKYSAVAKELAKLGYSIEPVK